MKRCLAILLSALLLMLSVPMVSAEGIYNDDQFNWGEGVCPHTNVVEIAAVASTCTVRGHAAHTKCADCGAVVEGSKDLLPFGDHAYSSEVTTAPTCTTAGVRTYTCSVCDHTYTETIVSGGHDYKASVTDPDCENGGYTTHTCSVCGDSYVDSQTAALGHTYEFECDTACAVCGGGEREAYHESSAEFECQAGVCIYCAVPMDAAEECISDAQYVCVDGNCIFCGEEMPAVSNHQYVGQQTTAPTCTEPGVKTYTCQCGVSYTEPIPVTSHKYDGNCDADCNACGAVREAPHYPVTTDCREICCVCLAVLQQRDENHVYSYECGTICGVCGGGEREAAHVSNAEFECQEGECIYCGEPMDAAEECTSDAPYDCVDGNCVFCGEEMPAVSDHQYEGQQTTAPTCTEAGVKTYTCECGDTYTEPVNATGHNYDAVVTAPDCENGGYTTYTCAACGDSYVADETNAAGHNYVPLSAVPPTCEEDGFERYYCTNCNDSYTTVLEATGHSYDAVVTAPDCVNGGYTTHTCSVCGHNYVDSQTDALGHVYDDDFDADCNVCGHVREVVVLGDVTGDGKVNNRDLGQLQRYLNEWEVTINMVGADLNGDGKINNRDLGQLQNLLNE